MIAGVFSIQIHVTSSFTGYIKAWDAPAPRRYTVTPGRGIKLNDNLIDYAQLTMNDIDDIHIDKIETGVRLRAIRHDRPWRKLGMLHHDNHWSRNL